jgi:hypothetical protein
MNGTKRLTGVCSECGGSIEFQAELIGTVSTCPRCRKQTELMLASPSAEPSVPRKVIIWTVVTAGILVGGLIVTLVGLKHFENLAARQRDRTAGGAGTNDAAVPAGFEVSAITLEKGDGGNGLFAVGTVMNSSNRRRSQVTVEFDLLDAGGQTLQVIRAYKPLLEPGTKWEIKLPAEGDPKPVTAKLASIREGK